jgi:hypothetical protein
MGSPLMIVSSVASMTENKLDLHNDVQALTTALILAVMAPDEDKAASATLLAEELAEKLGDQAEVVRQTIDTTLMLLQEFNQTAHANV